MDTNPEPFLVQSKFYLQPTNKEDTWKIHIRYPNGV